MVIEQLLLMLCVSAPSIHHFPPVGQAFTSPNVAQKRLNRWTNMEATTWAWCVGGSMVATYASRDATGCASGLSFCLCRRDGWPGGKRSNKVGNTCQTHCNGIRLSQVLVGGAVQKDVVMRKCMWLRCCYGKKPYGSPPVIPCATLLSFFRLHLHAAGSLRVTVQGAARVSTRRSSRIKASRASEPHQRQATSRFSAT